MSFKRTIFETILVRPSFVINQNSTSNQSSAGMPMIQSMKGAIFVFVPERLIKFVDLLVSTGHFTIHHKTQTWLMDRLHTRHCNSRPKVDGRNGQANSAD